ncbi:hypothetical protein [Hymenobacter latericus]|uniref:hypothetical protein n=1 Tax=Hymenobacter sp. YIM 151858-1 TaxID=2987688 RepID=UPI002227EB89|nr:hypothetical protein [Hymenobacter sp. YIM 151858-1]UYZ60082.1 hypothetical protein OIS50_04600 [Hymenobacter sp. YIM 151858-1]
MPESNPPARRKIALTGTYNTAPNVAPKAASDRNATYAYLEQFNQDPRGLQELYAAGINDLDDPLAPGQRINYGQLKARFASPATAKQMFESQAYRQGGYRDAGAYLQAMHDQGKARLMQRATATPQQVVFAPEALQAAAALRGQNFINETQVVLPDGTPRQVAAADMARRYTVVPRGTGAAAPGRTIKLQ